MQHGLNARNATDRDKTQSMVTHFKNADVRNKAKFRPASVLSCVSKNIFEAIPINQLVTYIQIQLYE